MNPHFIFNSMNSIQSYISGNDNFTAMTYLSKFAQLMRGILDHSRKSMISLEEETTVLNLYIELERLRFKHKFDYKLNIDPILNPETTYIPPMLVQPFVENAIKHGLKRLDSGGLLKIDFTKKNSLIKCTIEDNGIGRDLASAMKKGSDKNHQSLGMQVTRERIDAFKIEKNVQCDLQIVDLKNKEDEPEGTRVYVLFPFEEE
jgi:sensor histidine kinase YesM